MEIGYRVPVDGGRFVKQTYFGVVVAAVAVLSVSVAAHHGAASFDTTKEYTLKGKVTEWIWANPHCFLKFDAKDDTGDVRNWAVEVSNPTDMTRLGWARTSFKFGDEVTVVMIVAKNNLPVGRIRQVTLADGQVYSTNGGAVPAPAAGAAAPTP